MSPLSIDPSEVHVWHTGTDAFGDDGHAANVWLPRLHPDEVIRHHAFRFERDRRIHLATRALCRETLARYTGIDPSALRFRTNAHGRPEIAGPLEALPLRFNLANTDGRVACIVGIGRDVGVDVESLAKETPTLDLAQHYFAPPELADLQSLTDDARSERFVAYWTLKEAYLKARGVGLSVPLDQFAFTLDADGSIVVRFAPTLDDDAFGWQFARFSPTARHRMAIALRSARAERVRVVVREVDEDHWRTPP